MRTMTGLGARLLDEGPVVQLEDEQDAMEEPDVEECLRKVGHQNVLLKLLIDDPSMTTM